MTFELFSYNSTKCYMIKQATYKLVYNDVQN